MTTRLPWMALAGLLAGAAPVRAQQVGADSADSAGLGRFFPLPVVFYQPETGWGFGGALLHTVRLARDARTSANFAALIYTLKRQYAASLQSELYTAGDRFVLLGEVVGSHFPDKFYGLGNATRPDSAQDYSLDQARVFLAPRARVAPHVYAGLSLLYQWTGIGDVEPGASLASDTIPGARGGTLTGAGLNLVADTRDHTLGPRRGVYLLAGARLHDGALGSDFDYARLELDARAYLSTYRQQVLAVQLVATGSTGTPPFFDLAKLGGPSLLRGSYEGRFRDRQRVAAQAEYRAPVWGVLGVAAFTGVGQVARSWRDVRLAEFHVTGGAGVRVRLSSADRVNLRVDYGFGPGESGVYFALGEAF